MRWWSVFGWAACAACSAQGTPGDAAVVERDVAWWTQLVVPNAAACTESTTCPPPYPGAAGYTVGCVGGRCAYTCGFAAGDCDRVLANGCEASLIDGRPHCGGCGTTCAAGQACVPVQVAGPCLPGAVPTCWPMGSDGRQFLWWAATCR